MKKKAPYQQLDSNIVKLVHAVNAFASLQTLGSCGGHDNPTRAQWETGSWYVSFRVDKSEDGWLALEFLAWVVNNDYYRSGYNIVLKPYSSPPFLNFPGKMIRFLLEGYDGVDPEKLADFMNEHRVQFYVGKQHTEDIS